MRYITYDSDSVFGWDSDLGEKALAVVDSGIFDRVLSMEAEYNGGWDMQWKKTFASYAEMDACVHSEDGEWLDEFYLSGERDGRALYIMLDSAGTAELCLPEDAEDVDLLPLLTSLGYENCKVDSRDERDGSRPYWSL